MQLIAGGLYLQSLTFKEWTHTLPIIASAVNIDAKSNIWKPTPNTDDYGGGGGEIVLGSIVLITPKIWIRP